MIHKDQRFWDKAARKYASTPIEDVLGFEKSLTRIREIVPSGADVLELGCGTGTVALRLADCAERYLATDLSSGMISIAQEKLQAAREKGFRAVLEFRKATAEMLVAEGIRYDVVVGFSYLHLAGSLPTVLEHVHSLLKPGGVFISKTPCIGNMNPTIRLLLPFMRILGLAPSSVTVFSSVSLANAIVDAGFEILENEWHGSKKNDFRPFIVARAI